MKCWCLRLADIHSGQKLPEHLRNDVFPAQSECRSHHVGLAAGDKTESRGHEFQCRCRRRPFPQGGIDPLTAGECDERQGLCRVRTDLPHRPAVKLEVAGVGFAPLAVRQAEIGLFLEDDLVDEAAQIRNIAQGCVDRMGVEARMQGSEVGKIQHRLAIVTDRGCLFFCQSHC